MRNLTLECLEMKYEQDPDKPFDMSNPGKNVAEVAKNLGVAQSSLYRAIKKANYTVEVFNSDKVVRQIVCTFVSLDGAKKAWLMIEQLRRVLLNQIAKTEKITQTKDAEIDRLLTIIATSDLKGIL